MDEQAYRDRGTEKRDPETIGELKAYCEMRGMPLSRMRFFIGEDYPKARAFGIYEDGGRFIVYKNKANGERAVRYCGPDEAYAVRELFLKLLDECHRRDIWPDGRPEEEPAGRIRESGSRSRSPRKRSKAMIVLIALAAVLTALVIWELRDAEWETRSFRNGYYRYEGNDSYYLKKGSRWYWAGSADWYSRNGAPSGEVEYLGAEYDPAWGVMEFEASGAGQRYQSGEYTQNDSHNTYDYGSSDYSGWDAGDTDWNSDW